MTTHIADDHAEPHTNTIGGQRYQQSRSGRGDRLFPKRSNRTYWILNRIRTVYAYLIKRHLSHGDDVCLLDLGCGNMPYRPLFEPYVKEYIACDLEGNELANCGIDDNGIVAREEASCDIVLSSQVLEHVPCPVTYLSEAHRLLRPGGKLFLSTHGVWRYHPDPTDFWRWTGDGLRKQISSAGFNTVEFVGLMGPASTALQVLQDALLTRLPRVFQSTFTAMMQHLIQWTDKLSNDRVRNCDACVFILIAEKV